MSRNKDELTQKGLNLYNLLANWPAPTNISALTTTREPGQSKAPYASNNLALHVEDNPQDVLANRTNLIKTFSLPAEPIWLEQTHSTHCIVVEEDDNRIADAAVTRQIGYPLVIMTADCLPILFCNQQGTEIAAVHAGWRGLVNGILENTLSKINSSPDTLMAWIGPAICHRCFEVGEEVFETFVYHYPYTQSTFTTIGTKKSADLALMAQLILNKLGVSSVYQSRACSFEQKNEFYSYRRDGQTGRMASLIWFNLEKAVKS